MNALIIGAGGFVGRYLIRALAAFGYSVSATKLPFETISEPGCSVYDLDISMPDKISSILSDTSPDVIFHLAALSSVAQSWNNIHKTFEINVLGAINLLNCVKDYNKDTRVLLIGSSEEYGFCAESKMPVSELSTVNPSNPYAISKLSQTCLGKMYYQAFCMNIVMMRAFNHFGPGQPAGFVVPDFCRQIVDIESHKCGALIKTGNLSSKRDFTDVRDIVNGYIACAKSGHAGDIYNIGSGHAVEIAQILDKLIGMSSEKIEIEQDPRKMRPIDVPIVEADITRICRDTNWKPVIPLDDTLKDTLQYWRENN